MDSILVCLSCRKVKQYLKFKNMAEPKSLFLVFIKAVIVAIVLSFPIMWLWNEVVPILFKLPSITYLQTIQLLTLVDLLFKQNFRIK